MVSFEDSQGFLPWTPTGSAGLNSAFPRTDCVQTNVLEHYQMKWIGRLVFVLFLTGCTGIPDGLAPVSAFELPRYLGRWHEVARLDHSFERGLTQVTADYSLQPDGSVKVLNKGWSTADGRWEDAEGVARFVDDSPAGRQQGRLKVSFFGPFYGAYNIVKLAPDYSMALVVGPNLDYAWLLARSDQPAAAQCDEFYRFAASAGIETSRWIRLLPCK